MLYPPTINLLPDNKKNRLQILVRFIFAKDLLEISLLFYSLLAIVFLWSWITLLDEYNNTAHSTTLVNRENSTRSREVRETNTALRQFNRSAMGYIQLTPKLNEVINTLPADIKITSLIFDRSTNHFLISGTAKTRASLLNYETIVKQYAWLQNVTSPISQLFEKENINFEIRAGLKLGAPLPGATEKSNKR